MATEKQLNNRKLLIALMEHVSDLQKQTRRKFFGLSWFQKSMLGFKKEGSNLSKNKGDIINCGTKCCVSGWIAICPAFIEQGISQGPQGEAILNRTFDNRVLAIQILFGFGHKESNFLMSASYKQGGAGDKETPEDVINLVNYWDKGGSLESPTPETTRTFLEASP